MSSVEAAVEGTVAVEPTARSNEVTVLTAIAVAQVAWLGGLVYGVISLLT